VRFYQKSWISGDRIVLPALKSCSSLKFCTLIDDSKGFHRLVRNSVSRGRGGSSVGSISSESGYESESGCRVLMTKNREKKINYFEIFFGSKIAIYLSLSLLKGRPSYRRSLQPSEAKVQHFKR
jgi:hypothetical protein